MGKICDENRDTYIYTLEDPDTKSVRYVGKTVSPLKHRLSQHLTDTRGRTHKNNWIKQLLSNGKYPIIRIVDIVPWGISAEEEILWISYFSQHFNLTNLSFGGEGALGNKKTLEQIAKLRISLLKNSRSVHQYTLDGVYIQTFNSCSEAAEYYKLRRENINQCCLLRKKSHGGFIWSYKQKNEFSIEEYTHKPKDYKTMNLTNNSFVKKKRKVCITHRDTDVIILTDSVKAASFITKVSTASVSRECNGLNKTTTPLNNFKFKFI